jgi:hypothetical protein
MSQHHDQTQPIDRHQQRPEGQAEVDALEDVGMLVQANASPISNSSRQAPAVAKTTAQGTTRSNWINTNTCRSIPPSSTSATLVLRGEGTELHETTAASTLTTDGCSNKTESPLSISKTTHLNMMLRLIAEQRKNQLKEQQQQHLQQLQLQQQQQQQQHIDLSRLLMRRQLLNSVANIRLDTLSENPIAAQITDEALLSLLLINNGTWRNDSNNDNNSSRQEDNYDSGKNRKSG